MKIKAARVGLFNNTNHMNFTLARYLRDAGYEVKLHLFDEAEHFLPQTDIYDEKDLQFVEYLNWFHKGHWKTPAEEIRKVASQFDFLIGNDMFPAFLYKAGIRLDLMFPHGSEIFYKPYFKYRYNLPVKSQIGTFWEKYCQRQGLRQISTVAMPFYGELYEKHLRHFGIIKTRSFDSYPMVYAPQYHTPLYYQYRQSNEHCQRVKAIREKTDLLICQQGRQENADPASIHYKGNEKLFQAFRQLITVHKVNAHLILFEYGTDVENSKKLIHELGISESVTWLPVLPRKTIMPILSYADVGVGILAPGSYLTYGSLNEFLVMEVPIIHHLNPETLKHQTIPDVYPYINALTSEQVLDGLLQVNRNKKEFKEKAAAGRQWFDKRIVQNSITNIEKLIQDKIVKQKDKHN